MVVVNIFAKILLALTSVHVKMVLYYMKINMTVKKEVVLILSQAPMEVLQVLIILKIIQAEKIVVGFLPLHLVIELSLYLKTLNLRLHRHVFLIMLLYTKVTIHQCRIFMALFAEKKIPALSLAPAVF